MTRKPDKNCFPGNDRELRCEMKRNEVTARQATEVYKFPSHLPDAAAAVRHFDCDGKVLEKTLFASL